VLSSEEDNQIVEYLVKMCEKGLNCNLTNSRQNEVQK
jgi:hypothetical protein